MKIVTIAKANAITKRKYKVIHTNILGLFFYPHSIRLLFGLFDSFIITNLIRLFWPAFFLAWQWFIPFCSFFCSLSLHVYIDSFDQLLCECGRDFISMRVQSHLVRCRWEWVQNKLAPYNTIFVAYTLSIESTELDSDKNGLIEIERRQPMNTTDTKNRTKQYNRKLQKRTRPNKIRLNCGIWIRFFAARHCS